MSGVLIFKGMKVGVQPGDLSLKLDESGNVSGNLILSTAYNVVPLWLRVANDQLAEAKKAAEAVASKWSEDDDLNRQLLIAELGPSMQVVVACGVALDAIYDVLRPYAKVTQEEIDAWKKNKTARSTQITEIIRRVFGFDAGTTEKFKQNIKNVISCRDKAVHPALKLQQSCTRPDIPVGVDWKFSLFRYANSRVCFISTMEMLNHICGISIGIADVDSEMRSIVDALEELKVVTRHAHASDVEATGGGGN